MNLLAVTGIVIFVGMILFMLPPIPGLPIYLKGGIVLVSVGRGHLWTFGVHHLRMHHLTPPETPRLCGPTETHW